MSSISTYHQLVNIQESFLNKEIAIAFVDENGLATLTHSNPLRREGMKVWRGCVGQAGRSFQTFLAFLLRFFVKKKMKAKNGYGKQTEFNLEGEYKLRGFYSGNFLNQLRKCITE